MRAAPEGSRASAVPESEAAVAGGAPLLRLEDVRRVYPGGAGDVEALRGVSFSLRPGERVALTGPSGCGKTTLLHLLGGMDRPSAGRVLFEGRDLARLSEDALVRLRRERVGFVFQFFNLLPTLTLLENVALPLLLAGARRHPARERAAALVERVGLAPRSGHLPAALSGGERQRAAVARALVHRPALVLADEPTGSLDSAHGARVLDLLGELHRDLGTALVIATHSGEVATRCPRRIALRDGRVERDTRSAEEGG